MADCRDVCLLEVADLGNASDSSYLQGKVTDIAVVLARYFFSLAVWTIAMCQNLLIWLTSRSKYSLA